MHEQIILNSVKVHVAEWSSLEKELLNRIAVCSLCKMYTCIKILIISHLIVPVPGHTIPK